MAYYSILLFNILDVSIAETGESIPMSCPKTCRNRWSISVKSAGPVRHNLQRHNDAVYYRDEMRQLFITGHYTSGSGRSVDKYFWAIINCIAEEKEKLKHTPKELAGHRQHA